MKTTLVFNACEETHVFVNDMGSITIHQIVPDLLMKDVLITIPLMHIEPLVNALRNAKREALGSGE